MRIASDCSAPLSTKLTGVEGLIHLESALSRCKDEGKAELGLCLHSVETGIYRWESRVKFGGWKVRSACCRVTDVLIS